MRVDTQRVWLSELTYGRVRIELARLLVGRATGLPQEHADREQRELRIRQLQELITNAASVTSRPTTGSPSRAWC